MSSIDLGPRLGVSESGIGVVWAKPLSQFLSDGSGKDVEAANNVGGEV